MIMSYSTPNHMNRNAIEDNIIKNIRNLSRLKKTKNNAIRKKIRDMHILFKPDNEDYYESVWIGNAFNNNYIEYESKGDRNNNILQD